MESLLGFVETTSSFDVDVDRSCNYKLVPRLTWDEWEFVKDSLFSSSPHSLASALRRITVWRSRGCFPVVIEVTASIVEIQQKNPFFRVGLGDDALDSEEMLTMLYCMAIVRHVNGVVEKTCKKTEVSIAEAADAINIPRMLIDICHEGSHRDLPSLRLVRLASIKFVLPDILEMIPNTCLGILVPKEDWTGLVQNLGLQTITRYAMSAQHNNVTEIQKVIKSVIVQLVQILFDDWKPVVKKLSNKEPELLLNLIKAVLEKTETQEAMEYESVNEEDAGHLDHQFDNTSKPIHGNSPAPVADCVRTLADSRTLYGFSWHSGRYGKYGVYLHFSCFRVRTFEQRIDSPAQ
ncbi:hypothetical protein TEA_014695 [Camellia sinensis var. sinensis]|uniref:Uncharacterized protein n=1 Tax=Camellia sinensis var. sinensis TaxID=542762 RepID=A0A4S4DXH5_CAMSN|nr:hypothetical protein TEA_014695 [Camellia sinensis var. sinensis]